MSFSTAEVFRSMPVFSGVPDPQIQWLIDHGSIFTLQAGEYLFQRDQSVTALQIILTGKISVYFQQNDQKRILGTLEAKDVTGVLPYSRMESARGYGRANEESMVFALPKSLFPEMIREHHELTAAFVHFMSDRVRNFTNVQVQNEKLMALGKLSAGLAHELNNPASAIVRSSQALKKHLGILPDSFKNVTKIRMEDAQVDRVNQLMTARIKAYGAVQLSLMERSEQEDEVTDWLEDNGLEDGTEVAEHLVEFGFEVDDLEEILEASTEAYFPSVINWIINNLITEKMVGEIEMASKRIADLVTSVKGYTHMDQSQDEQAVDVHEGLQNTLTMLQHKLGKRKIEVVKEFAPDLNKVSGLPGELNQVWTNIIDNAIDAMEASGGTLLLRTFNQGDFVRLDIQDSGTGIPPEIVSQIFDPFFTTKGIGKGTGLGLEIVHKLVTKHKGDIKVRSQVGETVFELCFPAYT